MTQSETVDVEKPSSSGESICPNHRPLDVRFYKRRQRRYVALASERVVEHTRSHIFGNRLPCRTR